MVRGESESFLLQETLYCVLWPCDEQCFVWLRVEEESCCVLSGDCISVSHGVSRYTTYILTLVFYQRTQTCKVAAFIFRVLSITYTGIFITHNREVILYCIVYNKLNEAELEQLPITQENCLPLAAPVSKKGS